MSITWITAWQSESTWALDSAIALLVVDGITAVGVYDVPIHLHETVKVELKVWVVEEKEASAEVDAEASGDDAPATEPVAATTEGETESA